MTFPAAVTEDLKQTIDDWFGCREVCDDNKFNLFFNRLLNRDLPRYNQLLRIEPGISDYDWLVQNYREMQRDLTESGTSSRGVEIEGTESSTLTLNSKTNTKTFANADERSHTDFKVTEQITEGDLQTEVSYGKTTTNGNSQSGEDYQVTNTHEITGKLVNKSTDNTSVSQRSLGKNAPQSASYGGGSQNGMPAAFDWSYPGTQNETETKGNGGNTTNETYGADNYKETDTSKVKDLRKVTLGGKDTTKETDTRVHERETSGSYTDAHRGTITDIQTGGETTSKTSGSETNETGSSSKTGLDRIQETGRNVDPATLLTNAKSFIMGTNAWVWLAGQLETCFMGIYE